jgi:hypothetical protein
MKTMDWRMRAFVIGGMVGAIFGLASAYIYVRSVEKRGEPPELAPSDAVGLGLTALGLLRQIASINEEEKTKKKAR